MKKLVLVIAFLLLCSTAWAITIDFQSLEHDDSNTFYHGINYSEDNYNISIHPPGVDFLATVGVQSNNYTGTTAMYSTFVEGFTTLTHSGGESFNLTSIDLSALSFNRPQSRQLAFFGELSGGGSVSQTFTLNSPLIMQTFAFSGDFVKLTSVNWKIITSGVAHQFDNIVINEGTLPNQPNPNPIPEPTTIALLGIGIAGVTVSRKFKRETH